MTTLRRLWNWAPLARANRATVTQQTPTIRPVFTVAYSCDKIEAAASPLLDGEWPEDLDEVPAWRLRQERRAAEIGASLPNYRTRREFDAMVARCEAALAKPSRAPSKLLPPLPGVEAAGRFLAWLRDEGQVGTFPSDELSALYASHCEDQGREPTPENSMRRSLVLLPGVSKRLGERPTASGQRQRPTFWDIEPLEQLAAAA